MTRAAPPGSCCSSAGSRPSTTSRASPRSRSRGRSIPRSTRSSRSASRPTGDGCSRARRARCSPSGRDALPAAFEVEGDLRADAERRARRRRLDVDVVIPLLHGPYGEDGTVQGLLELAGPARTSARVCSAPRSAMDKVAMKQMFAGAGLPHGALLDAPRRRTTSTRSFPRVETDLGFPCFVKPANMGSSVGVSKAPDPARAARRARPRARVRRVGARRGDGERPRDRGRHARRRSARRVAPRRGRPRGRLLRLRRQVRGRQSRAARAARRCRPRRSPRCSASRCTRSRRAAARRWPGSTSSSRDDGVLRRERAEHDSGLHADLDVPAAVGGVGRPLRGAARPAHRSRHRERERRAARRGRQR